MQQLCHAESPALVDRRRTIRWLARVGIAANPSLSSTPVIYARCTILVWQRSARNIEIENDYVLAIMTCHGIHAKTEAVDMALRHLAGQPHDALDCAGTALAGEVHGGTREYAADAALPETGAGEEAGHGPRRCRGSCPRRDPPRGRDCRAAGPRSDCAARPRTSRPARDRGTRRGRWSCPTPDDRYQSVGATDPRVSSAGNEAKDSRRRSL